MQKNPGAVFKLNNTLSDIRSTPCSISSRCSCGATTSRRFGRRGPRRSRTGSFGHARPRRAGVTLLFKFQNATPALAVRVWDNRGGRPVGPIVDSSVSTIDLNIGVAALERARKVGEDDVDHMRLTRRMRPACLLRAGRGVGSQLVKPTAKPRCGCTKS